MTMEQFNPQEELIFIKQIINDSRKSVLYNFSFVFWGVLIALALLLTYTFILLSIQKYVNWIWVGTIIIGWCFSYWELKKEKIKGSRTFIDRITSAIWYSTGIIATIIAIIGLFFHREHIGVYISSLISLSIGGAYFVTGNVHNSKWFKNLAYGWWSGALVLFFITDLNSLLIMTFLIIVLQVVPGIILLKEMRNQGEKE